MQEVWRKIAEEVASGGRLATVCGDSSTIDLPDLLMPHHIPLRLLITLVVAIAAVSIGWVSRDTALPSPHVPTDVVSPVRLRHDTPRHSSHLRRERPATGHDRADVFAGTGAWIDIFDDWTQPEPFTRNLAKRHVDTLYVQTSNSSQPYEIYQPERMGSMLEHAHDSGLRVVAWYLPELRSIEQDLNRSVRAAAFRSPRGDRFDGFALDIESQAVPEISLRVKRLIQLSNRVRSSIAPSMPFGAITPPPSVGTDNPRSGWPMFPWKRLAHVYDAWLPMSFFVLADPGSGHARAARVRDRFIADVRHIHRRTAGAPQRPIHIVAETAAEAGTHELSGLSQAARTTKVTGASVYDAQTSTRAEWRTLRRLALPRTQPTQRH